MKHAIRAVARVYDWLADNGVDELLPENPMIVIDAGPGGVGAEIVFTAFVWVGPPDWDATTVHPDWDTMTRRVPLRVPPPPRVADTLAELELFAALHGREHPQPRPARRHHDRGR